MENTILQPPKALEHLPFCPQALEFGKLSKQMDCYARAVQRWARFFAEQAKERQKDYQKVRESFLIAEAIKNRSTTIRGAPRDLTLPSSARAKREKALEDLISVGLSHAEAEKIRATL